MKDFEIVLTWGKTAKLSVNAESLNSAMLKIRDRINKNELDFSAFTGKFIDGSVHISVFKTIEINK